MISSINSSIALNSSIQNSFRYANTMTTGSAQILQRAGVVNISSTSKYYLIGYCNFTAGSIMIRSQASNTTATTTASITSSLTVVITAINPSIIVGMIVTGTGISGICLVFSISSTTITFTTAQTLSTSVNLSFAIVSNTNFTATRIA